MYTNPKTLYDTLPGVAALHKTPQFDPRRYLKRIVCKATGEVTHDIELKYKKLWFRLAYPKGRIVSSALQITDSAAVIECHVFFDETGEKPASGYIAQTAKATHGELYIQMAQYTAEHEALSAAGFGCQFNDLRPDPNAALVTAESIPAEAATALRAVPAAPIAKQPASPPEAAAPPAAQPAGAPEAAADTDTGPATQEEPAATETPAEENAAVPSRFTPDMPVETILAEMTREEAEAVVVDIGTCKGWTLAEVLEKRPVSLQWYASGYNGDNNLLRAGARILLAEATQENAA